MHQVANFSEFEYDGNVGVQIGPHGSFTYAALSFDRELLIFRKEFFNPYGWKSYSKFTISSRSSCICTTDVSAAYGIIGDELFVASFGVKPGEDVEKLHLFSIDLINDSVTDYSRNIIIAADLKDNLCEKCSPSSLVALNKSNTNEIFIVPWTSGFFSTNIGFADYVQTKLLINREKQTCEFLGFFGFKFLGPFYAMNRSLNCSNMGNLEFGKIVYFQGDNLFLCEIDKIQLHIIESDLRAQSSYTFYNCSKGLQCMSFDRQLEEEGEVDTFCCIYDVIIDVERHQAQFKKVKTICCDLFLSSSITNYGKRFFLNENMLIFSKDEQTYTYFLNVLSLTKLAYLTASNSYSNYSREYEKYKKIQNPTSNDRLKVHRERGNLGLNLNEVKQLTGYPSLTFYDNFNA